MVARKIKVFGILFLLMVVQTVYGQKDNEEKLVINAFENYKSALLNGKGEEAVKFVDSRTVKYYGDMLELAKSADSAKIETLSIFDKIIVFTIRHRVSKEDVLNFDAKSIFAHAVKIGMIDKNSVTNFYIGEVTIDKDFAKGQSVVNGQKTPIYFHFYKEDKQWKVDLTSLFPLSTAAFEQLIEESGMGQNEFLFLVLEMSSGKKPGNEIWKPII